MQGDIHGRNLCISGGQSRSTGRRNRDSVKLPYRASDAARPAEFILSTDAWIHLTPMRRVPCLAQRSLRRATILPPMLWYNATVSARRWALAAIRLMAVFRKDTPWVRYSPPAGNPIYFKRPANFPPYSTQDSMLFGSGFQRQRRPSSITWNPAASSCLWIILTDSPLQP